MSASAAADHKPAKRKEKRVNSEPDALAAVRRKENSEENDQSSTSGLFTRIKGFKTDFMKRVSRVVLDDDQVRQLRREHEERNAAAAAQPPSAPVDPNLKAQKTEQSLHDVYKELQFRKFMQLSDSTGQNTESPSSGGERPKSPDSERPEEETEVSRVLQELKDGKEEISCSRHIVQRAVTLRSSADFKPQRPTQGGQFGIRIVGGKKVSGGVLCAFIASIVPGSPASKSLQLQEGDLVLSWNGRMLIGMTYEEVLGTLDDEDAATLVVSNYLRGSYRRYRPRSSNSQRTGSIESILRGTTNKWIAITRRGMAARSQELRVPECPEEESSAGDQAAPAASSVPRPELQDRSDASITPAPPSRAVRCKLEMSVVYVTMEKRLSFHLIQAGNIPYREAVEGLDLFCKLQLTPEIGSCESKKRSRTAMRTYSPYWNQHFEFQPISEPEVRERKLSIVLLAHHWLHKDEVLGEVDIDLSQKEALSGHASWFYLTKPIDQSADERNVSEASKEKSSSLQHRITFSTFDSKKVSADIRRSASDTCKPAGLKPIVSKRSGEQLSGSDSSDNVFSPYSVHSHLSNIKETEDGQRPPIQVRGSPRRRPRVAKERPATRLEKGRDSTSSAELITPAIPSQQSPPSAGDRPSDCSSSSKPAHPCSASTCPAWSRTCRSNSEDFSITKHRVLPTPPTHKGSIVMTLPSKKMTSPLLISSSSHNFGTTRVVVTRPEEQQCSSSESISMKTLKRPSPDGKSWVGTGDDPGNLGPGQLSVVAVPSGVSGSIVLTLVIEKNMLILEVVQANDLPVRPSTGLPPDAYVKTYVLMEQHRSHKEKTRLVRGNCNPVFNERITYIVNPSNQILQVMVWDEVGALRRNTLLGEILVDLNYVYQHGPLQGRYKLYPALCPAEKS